MDLGLETHPKQTVKNFFYKIVRRWLGPIQKSEYKKYQAQENGNFCTNHICTIFSYIVLNVKLYLEVVFLQAILFTHNAFAVIEENLTRKLSNTLTLFSSNIL